MAKFTDIFIKRPVLACVISLLIFFLGFKAVFELPVQQFPKMENTVISVSTYYPGASANLVQSFISAPLESQVAGADGVDYITSESIDGQSTISAYIKLNYPPNDAFTNVMSQVQQARQSLPREALDPIIAKSTGDTFALMYLGFYSEKMTPAQINNYLTRVVQPKLQTVTGVSQAQIMGGNTFAMRIWMDTHQMAGLGVTPNDITAALQADNFQSAAGHTQGEYVEIAINPRTDLQTPEGFGNIIVKKSSNGSFVRLKDVAKVELGQEDYESSVYFNGDKAVFMAIYATPSANPLSVISGVKDVLPTLVPLFPPTLSSKIVYDSTKYIRASIHEVMLTIAEATIIVSLVIFLFLGSLRTVIIPVVTIPLSLIGVFMLMLVLGYSINLLTLLALVLAIGMVVDDAIVVVENVYRHIEAGSTPMESALRGAREIATPIISMTLTLAAVYAPIGFMGGLTGALFTEFAFTLAAAVIISGVVALTLSPMMCSLFLTPDIGHQKLVHYVDQKFTALHDRYYRALHNSLNYRFITIIFAFVVLVSCGFLYLNSSQELAPTEDQGAVFVMGSAPQWATLKYIEKYTNHFNKIYNELPSKSDSFIGNGIPSSSQVISAAILKPWNERKQSQDKAMQFLNAQFSKLPELEIQAFPMPSLPVGGDPLPIQFVITSILPYSTIYPVMDQLISNARKSGLFLFINGGLKYNKPQIDLEINRDKAAQLGIGVQDIAQSLATVLGGNYTNLFSAEGRSYEVIQQIQQKYRLNPSALGQIYLRTNSGKLVPLSTVIKVHYSTQPNTLTRFQQLNSTTIEGLMTPGVSLAQGLDFLRAQAKQFFPSGMTYDYAGVSRQYIQEGNALVVTFVFSLIIIFLVLSAQFESFRDPLVVMISVPMAICGALLMTNWGLATVNIYTQIGLITLIGLISKHGILMVQFANQLRQEEGLDLREAIEKAAAIRLRPVLMTTVAMILGVLPLLLASGAGAASRFDIGLIIASGMAIGTLFTLFVVPVMYTLKTKDILRFLLFVAITVALFYFVIYVVL